MKNWGKKVFHRRFWQKLAGFLIMAAVTIWSTPARTNTIARQANQRHILPGGRAAMLGGAYSALSEDASGSFYNPSGLAFANVNRVDLSVSAYNTATIVNKNLLNDETLDERSDVFFPSFLGGTTRFSALTLGYSFMTLDSRNVYHQNVFENLSEVSGAVNSYSRTHQEVNNYIMAGTSAALNLTTNLAIGYSAFYYQRRIEATTNQLAIYNGGGIVSINDAQKTLNEGVAHVVGVLYKFSSFSLGLSTKLAFAISDQTSVITELVQHDPDTNTGDNPEVKSFTRTLQAQNELNPTTYRLGFAWIPNEYFLISSDILVHEGVKSRFKDSGGFDLLTTVNYSIGTEIKLGNLVIRGGYFTNSSMFKKPEIGSTNQPTHINYVGYSTGIAWDVDSVQGHLGMTTQTGEGKAQIITDSLDIQDVEAHNTTYIIGTKIPLK